MKISTQSATGIACLQGGLSQKMTLLIAFTFFIPKFAAYPQ